MTATSAYQADIQCQPDALRAFAGSQLPEELLRLKLDDYDRVILTGMGASHIASHQAWRSLVAQGHPTWWLSTAELLDAQALISKRSLLWVTSQSGESGEVVALLERVRRGGRPRTLLATTNDPDSHLAAAADVVVALHCGAESSVSTKTYVTTLAAHERALHALRHDDDATIVSRILTTAEELRHFEPDTSAIASAALAGQRPRFALVASAGEISSALAAALLLKEAAKVPAEGFARGDFRHGPIEIAGPGLTAILFGSGATDAALARLGEDLTNCGSLVVHVDPGPSAIGPRSVATGAASPLGRAVCASKLVQLLTVELALLQGIEPGTFRIGEKVTVSI